MKSFEKQRTLRWKVAYEMLIVSDEITRENLSVDYHQLMGIRTTGVMNSGNGLFRSKAPNFHSFPSPQPVESYPQLYLMHIVHLEISFNISIDQQLYPYLQMNPGEPSSHEFHNVLFSARGCTNPSKIVWMQRWYL